MRVLTDPVEIRAFRKRQARKILRMMKASVKQNIRKAWFIFRDLLVKTSLISAFIALMMLSAVIVGWCGIFLLEHCTVNW